MPIHVVTSNEINHVSKYTVKDFENIIRIHSDWVFLDSKPVKFVAKMIRKCPFPINIGNDKRHFFSILMNGLEIENYMFPFVLKNAIKSIYLFDVWDSNLIQIGEMLRKYKITNFFCSSKQASEGLKKIVDNVNVYWVPEGIEVSKLSFKSYEEREIDVLQFGRKHVNYHNILKSFCNQSDDSQN